MLKKYTLMCLMDLIHLLIFYVVLLKPLLIHGNNTPLLNPLQIRPNLSISDRVLPIQLVDLLDFNVRVPRRKQLRSQVLLATLGKDLDSSWMSAEKPRRLSEDGLNETVSKKLIDEMKNLNLSHEISADNSDSEQLDNAIIGKFEKWLLQKASCPVRYVWDDIGPLFWPRWIKRGECINGDGSKACSWPPGMHCVPSESITIHLLRWHCRPKSTGVVNTRPKQKKKTPMKRPKRSNNKNVRCQWLKVPYPVTSRCNCSC